jgi:hypothetical protein
VKYVAALPDTCENGFSTSHIAGNVLLFASMKNPCFAPCG